ncbi:hypothetical protein ACKWTF_010569 [Chironomus riparius]
MQIYFRTVPIYFWIFTIWCMSKVSQYMFNEDQTIWELIWKKSLKLFGDDEYSLFVNGILATSTIVLVSLMTIYSIFDFTLKPDFIRKYKINPKSNEPPDVKKFMKVLLCASFTGVFLTKPGFMAVYYAFKWRGFPNIYILPNITTVMITCFINDHIYDIANYTVHRTLHHKLLYKHIHKMHHEFISSIAIALIHAHPIEHLFSNIFPIAIVPFVLRCHISTAWIWVMVLLASSIIEHSGYHLPFINSTEFHDFHHVKFDSNYSTLGLMDRIFGTDKAYRNSINAKRDKLLLSFKSTRELYPDEDSKVMKNQ